MPMQMGFNNEFDYRDLRFHIQTEDRGLKAAKIESHIFHSGNILDTSVVSYEKVLAADLDEKERDSKIQAMMKANHRLLYQRLLQGDYDNYVGLSPQQEGEKSEAEVVDPEEFAPSQDRVSDKVRRIEAGELEPIDVAAQQNGGEPISLASLRDKLDSGPPSGTPPTPASASSAGVTASGKGRGKSTPPPFRKGGRATDTVPSTGTVFDYPDTGVRAFRGLVHTEQNLNVTELILEAL